MTTTRQIVTDSLREAGIIAAEDEPEEEIFTEGLRILNRLYASLFGNELGEPLETANYGQAGLSNYYAQSEDISSDISSSYAPCNLRLIFNLDEAKTLYLPPNPQAGARFAIVDNAGNLSTYNLTIDGNGRRIEDSLSITLDTDSLTREWFYRDDLANWLRVADLTADDVSPLPQEFDDLLTTLLAFRLNPRHGATTSNEMIEITKRVRKQFRARYRQTSEQKSEMGLYSLPSTRKYRGAVTSIQFNRGQ